MKLVCQVLVITASTLLTASVFAAGESQAVVAPTSAINQSETLIPSISTPRVGPFQVKAAFDSWNTSGRQEEPDSSKGRRYKMKNEFSAALIHDTGWGLQAMGVQSGSTNTDDKKSGYSAGDPSASLIHPTLYDQDGLKITGKFRRYFPETTRSLDRHQQQWAYYMYTEYSMPRQWAVWNQLTPRYFAQDHYEPKDTKYYTEDLTTLKKTVNSWFKYGVGQHTQVEWHDKTTMGTVVEVMPLADFVFSKNVFIEPHVLVPLYKQSEVYDSPRAAAVDSLQYELFLHMAL